MIAPASPDVSARFSRGVVVSPADDLMGVQSPDGALVPCERLGPGVVEQIGSDERVLVRWWGVGLDTWMEPHDLRALGPHAHLITVHRCDGRGNSKLLRHKVITTGGFQHNWTVELRPKNVMRVLRADGLAWTFSLNPIFRRVNTVSWSQPPGDDDAEALTAAELALT